MGNSIEATQPRSPKWAIIPEVVLSTSAATATDLQICFRGVSIDLLLPLGRVSNSSIDHIYSLGSTALLALLLRRVDLVCSNATCVGFASLVGGCLAFRLHSTQLSLMIKRVAEHTHGIRNGGEVKELQ